MAERRDKNSSRVKEGMEREGDEEGWEEEDDGGGNGIHFS